MNSKSSNKANGNGTDSAHLTAGDRVGAYVIERLLGSGGMADVYYAIHDGLQRPSAIKVLRASLAADDIHLQRFMQEARAAASLVHPNIVQVYDVGQDGEHRYIAQEFIPGSNLRQYLSAPVKRANELLDQIDARESEQTPALTADEQTDAASSISKLVPPSDRQLSIQETLSILLQVLAALTKSATSGIVHRDIKPENIMLTQDGAVKVADFGLARILLADDPQLTRAGTTLGTPMYMSPEQIQEGKVDVRSDLYSLGVTLFHMLSGRPPFVGSTPLALAMQHVQAPVPDIRQYRDGIPQSLVDLLGRLLAKNPDDRFHNPSEVLDVLRSHRDGDLRSYWPDQTIPLPGVSTNGDGPMPATLALQSRLRKLNTASRRKVAGWLGMAALWFACFGLGAAISFDNPFRNSTSQIYKVIERRDDVEQQYRWALLNTDSSPFSKWEAVSVFFPKEESPVNRYYAGLASLQLARSHCGLREYDEAKKKLRATLDDPAMDDVIKALAHLQFAAIEAAAGRDDARDTAVDEALRLASSDRISSAEQIALDSNVRLLEQAIQDHWFRDRPQSQPTVQTLDGATPRG